MRKIVHQILFPVLTAFCCAISVQAGEPLPHVGVVVMHGKGSNPSNEIRTLASRLGREGFQVANLEMPWSGRRDYDVDLDTGVMEITRALDEMRGKGATRLFVAGHSQGGLFAVLYGGRHKVDGVIAIAPGGQVDQAGFLRALPEHVHKAGRMKAEGKGSEKARFADFEGKRGVTPLRTTAAIYLSWFDPSGAHTSKAFERVLDGTPVLYVAPTRDYPALITMRDAYFYALPEHENSRLLEVNADHMGSVSAASGDIAAWIRTIAAK